MSWQLIYTSAPRGLLSGQSGFCTVARSADLREALVQRLEQISSYHYLRVAEASVAGRNPTISAFRLLDLRGAKYYILSRIQPCGLDFTARTNHLAHHLIFQADELAQSPSPAAILRHWPGWVKSWSGEPRLLDAVPAADFAAAAKSFLPAQTWARLAGDAGRAAGLLESECLRGCYLVCPPGSEEQVLQMYCETLQLLNLNGQFALRPWRHPFTTFLQAEDNAAEFQWRACQEETPAWQHAVKRSMPLLPLASVRVPSNSLAKVAREGLKPPPAPAAASSSGTYRYLPAERKPPAARPMPGAATPPAKAQRASGLSFVRFRAFVKFRLSLAQQWFARQSPSSRLSLGIFIAALLALAAMKLIPLLQHPPPVPETPVTEFSAMPEATSSPTQPLTASDPVSEAAPLPDPNQLGWLTGNTHTFLLTVSDITKFNLPIDQISPLQNLINRFDRLQTLTNEILLSVQTNSWDEQIGEVMSVNSRKAPELTAQANSGLEFAFNYESFITDKNPAVQAVFNERAHAFSVQFHFSPTNSGEAFRLLMVNDNDPPAPVHLSARWLRAHGESIAASLRPPLGPLLLGQYTLLEKQKWQLRPFIKVGAQTNYLYAGWPRDALPREGEDLNFAAVKERLAALAKPSVDARLNLNRQLEQLTNAANCPLGKYLTGVPADLESLARWTNAPPSQTVFLAYLGDLQKAAIPRNEWVTQWDLPLLTDPPDVQSNSFKKLDTRWRKAVAGLAYDANYGPDYFNTTWRKLHDLETVRDQLRVARVDENEKLLQSVPNSWSDIAYVALYIINPRQPQHGLEIIRFDGP